MGTLTVRARTAEPPFRVVVGHSIRWLSKFEDAKQVAENAISHRRELGLMGDATVIDATGNCWCFDGQKWKEGKL